MARRDITGAVDFGYLESYAAGDMDLVQEVLGLFREQAAVWTPLLEAGSEGWSDAVHTLKGAARGIGAYGVAQACEAAETAEPAVLPARLEAVRDALDAASGDIAAYTHEQAIRGLRSPF